MQHTRQLSITLCLIFIFLFPASYANSGYQTPSPTLSNLIEQPSAPSILISPDNQFIAQLTRANKPSISELAQPEYRLAGLTLSQKYHGNSRFKHNYQSITLITLQGDVASRVYPIMGGQFVNAKFSPNSKYLSLVEKTEQGLFLLTHNIKTKQTSRLISRPVNAVLGMEINWLKDSSAIITKLVNRDAIKPIQSTASAVPIIHQTHGEKSAQRTYQNLLSSPADEAMFEYLATSDLVKISLDGHITVLIKQQFFSSADISPDGRYLLFSNYARPFSYLVRYRDFPKITHTMELSTKRITTIATLPLAEKKSSDFDKVRPGFRYINWRKDAPATLYLVNALSKSQQEKPRYRDKVSLLSAPFTEKPKELLKLKWRFAGIAWQSDDFALITEKRDSKRLQWTWQFSPKRPSERSLWHKNAYRDRYAAPGQPLYALNQFGESVLLQKNGQLLMTHSGASEKGDRPKLTQGASSENSKMLWQSSPTHHEKIIKLLDPDNLIAVVARQSADTPLNYFVSDLRHNTQKPLTHITSSTQDYQGITKQLVTYQRDDGVNLSGTLYLPKGYDKSQGPLPVVMWAYPREYKSKDVAGQVNYSPNRYRSVSYWGPMPFLANGFAVFDKVAMPVIGLGDQKPNDQFRAQLVANAQAAIDTLVEMGVADRKRIAIGGHSYGAFMVGNLLAHSDLFVAGIARSGAYNRSLTPFGFQGEKRNFWQAQSLYSAMSPFFHADKINEPMLMIHGEADPNSGTFPMQSIRLFNAIKGLGGNARLVLLPYEGHSYKAKESLLHMLAEEERWLLQHLK